MVLKTGDAVPAFTLADQDGCKRKLSEFGGQWVVLYAYPKDDTPGCTTEATEFSHLVGEFQKRECVILGVSPDPVERHRKFRDKHSLKIDLLSDPDHRVLEKYGAWGKKKNYGKEYFGVIRSTFLIDPRGKLAYSWRSVRAKGHAAAVLERLVAVQK